MTDNDIIKDLECYIDEADSFYATAVLKNSLDLINRQKAELEDLREIVFTDRTEAIKNLKAEVIKEFAERLKDIFGYGWVLGSAVKTHIDNLVKEMTEEE